MKKTRPLYRDLMAKYIFGTEENLIYTSHLLELFFKLKSGTLSNATIRNNVHLSRENINKKGFEMDIVVETSSKEVINIEFYSKYDKNSEIKSFMYITNKFSSSLNVGEKYNQAKKVTQINFVKNNLMHDTGKVTSEYLVINKDDTDDQIVPELFRLFIVDLDQEVNSDYNNDELMKWIKLIEAETDEEMQEIVKGNKMMEEVYEKMKEFSQEEWVNDYFSKERLVASQHDSELKEQKEKLTEEFNAKERLVASQHDSELKEQKEKLTEEFNAKERLVASQHDSELKEQKEKLTEEFNAKERLVASQHDSELKEQKEKLTEEFNAKERLVASQHDSELKEQKEKLTEEFNAVQEEEINKMIENMLKDNISIENISKYTNMPINKIKDIKKKLGALK